MTATTRTARPAEAAAATSPFAESAPVQRMMKVLRPMLGVGIVLVVWWVLSIVLAELRIIPSPAATLDAFVSDLPLYPENAGATLTNAGIGYLAGNVLAIVTAVAFVRSAWAERLLLRIAIASFCVPPVAITPILVIVLPDDAPKQVLAALGVFFTTLMSCVLGLRSADRTSLDVVRSMGGGEGKAFAKVRLQSMLPGLFAGLQIAAPAALLGAILGEFLGSNRGLGVMLIQSQSSFEVPRTWAVAIVMAMLSGIAYWIIGIIARRATPWVGSRTDLAIGATPLQTTRGVRSTIGVVLGFVGSLVVILGLWWGAIIAFDLDSYFAKTPLDVLNYLVTVPAAAENRDIIFAGLGITLRDAGIGYVIGTVLAIVVSVLVVVSRVVRGIVTPLALALRSVPLIAIIPLLALVFGRDLIGVTVIVSIVTFFPAFVSVVNALESTPALASDVVRSMGGGSTLVMVLVRLPYAVPAILTSAKIAVPGAISGATLAEWLATGEGLGSMIVRDFAASRFSALWSEAVLIITVSVLFYSVIALLERRALRTFAA